MALEDDFERVRREPDPLVRGRLATRLLALYQQRAVELARLRKAAVDQLRDERGMSYAEVAAALELSKGRIGQIRQSGPPVERGFFGTGPVTVAVPLREVPGRALPVISAEDTISYERLTDLLRSLQFVVEQFRIPIDGQWEPTGDVIAICGPKSSIVTAEALRDDPALKFHNDGSQWVIEDRRSGRLFTSPMDDTFSVSADVSYVGRLPLTTSGSVLLIAGIHALGSVGAVDYLARELTALYRQVGQNCFSMVVSSTHDGDTVTGSEVVCGPWVHE